MLEDLDEKNKKKPNLVMRALKGIWGFAKDVGCGLLTAYLTMKFGFKSIRQWTEYTAEKILSNKEYDQGFKNYSVFLKFSSNCNTNMWFIIYIKVNHYWNASFKS